MYQGKHTIHRDSTIQGKFSNIILSHQPFSGTSRLVEKRVFFALDYSASPKTISFGDYFHAKSAASIEKM
jgi:hypothetical protein